MTLEDPQITVFQDLLLEKQEAKRTMKERYYLLITTLQIAEKLIH